MMNRRILLSLWTIIFIMTGFEIQPAEANHHRLISRPHYQIEAQYDPHLDQVRAHMVVTLPKNQFKKQKEVYFHLFPNAFRQWRFDQVSKPTKPGFIDISKVSVNRQSVKPVVRETIMKVPLPKTVSNENQSKIDLDFMLQLPRGGTRLNTFKNTAFLAQWYPMLAVKDREGWHIDPYTTTGDPFYSIMSDFDITIHTPRGYEVISTAQDQNQQTGNSFHLKQNNVRDFAAVITRDYRVLRKNVDGIEVNLWYLDGMEDVITSLHQAALNGMHFYNQRFGKYPYREVDVVLGETGFGIAGMEYPGLVTSVPKIPTREGEKAAINVVVHELAHQWWYGVVGNNQVKEPWLDEGLTTFSEFLYMQEKMNEHDKSFLDRVTVRTNEIHRTVGLTSAEPLYRYPDSVYGLMVYVRPAAMLYDLMKQVGTEKMMKILSSYYKTYQYRVATTGDFIKLAKQVTGKNLDPFFQKWLYFKSQ
ncbi:Peptidase family M1 [Seinonella peptonophila]|uniref:Peptidase family M1 n=1 Tax=Seinonella peptonophila TaxID=112248 RepID=A0A1M4V6F4_9BACL|nr:M1 family metallopeptidase [Seinonella peptonophila]SHE64529.1 Peptidase family M1 [Seinonella peptonophila]